MSKMSNLKKGVVGVCAATMLAGMCAVPAFALDSTNGTSTEGGGLDSDATASSTVSLDKGDVSANISATVPTTMPVAIADGVFTAPTKAAITNTSTGYGIKVVGVSVAEKNANLTLVAKDGNLVSNSMKMSLAAGSDTTSVLDLGASTIPTPDASIWKMGTEDSDKTIEITASGDMGGLNGALLSGILDGTGNTLFKIQWTIAADLG